METQQDVLIFTAEDLGKFSAKFYKKLNRQDGVKRSWAHWIWHRTLPSNISAFLWKVIRHAIPVDSRIRTKGIVMASRCHCCRAYEEETIVHLFLNPEVAKAVWQYVGTILKMPYLFRSVNQALNKWMKIRSQASCFELCRMSTTAYILRENIDRPLPS